MKLFFRIFLTGCLVLFFAASCATTKKKEKVEPETEGAAKLDESFDPLILDDNDIHFKEPERVKTGTEQQPEYLPRQEEFNDLVPSPENKLVDGYRIQILSTKDLESATRAKTIAEEQFSDIQVKFYLEFDSPYYKVRMGDFKSRENAEDIREVVRSRGYPKSWIVKTKVWSHPEFPAEQDSLSVDSPDMY